MIRRLGGLLALAVLAAGCSKGSNLSVSALSGPGHPSRDGGTVSSGSVTVNRIRVVIRKVSLEDSSGSEIRVGPCLADLSGSDLLGGIHPVCQSANVPAGTYCEILLVINTLPVEKAGGDPGLIEMAHLHASIAVDGTVGADGGSTFTFTTPMELQQFREGAFVVGPSANLTLNFDASGWFKAPDGSDLDPRVPSNRGRILANIRHSIRIFPDRDRHGEDEDECECRDEDDGDDHVADGGFRDGGEWCGRPDDDGHHKVICKCKHEEGCALPDGGTPDGGTPDGGTPDGGTPDGGTPDGGTPDGGAPDGGPIPV